MSTHRRLSRPSIAVLAVALAGLGACQKAANQASINPADAPPPLAALALTDDSTLPPPAPATDALPAAPPIRTASLAGPPDASYAYVDRAYEVNHGFGDAPPDYAFDYDGGQPWAWRSDDGYERVDEPVNGGDRDYYYEPNSDEPYLVRDGDYSYGYRGGILVVVYDREGRPLPADQYGRYSDRAARLLYRARQLRGAEQRQSHHGVGRTAWQQRRNTMMTERQTWTAQQQSNPDWRTYHDQSAPQYVAFDAMRARREAEAVRVDQALQDRQAEQRDRQAAQRAQAAVQAQAQGRAPGGLRPSAPPAVAGPPAPGAQATGVSPATQARVQAEQDQQTQTLERMQAQQQQDINRATAASQAQVRVQAQAQARQQALKAAAAQRAATASQAQANAQAAAQRQAEAQAAAAKVRSDALVRQQAAQQARVQAQQQIAAQAQARSQALAQQRQQAAAQRQAQLAAGAQQRAQALAQQQAQMKARQATQDQAAAQAQARAQAAAQQRVQAQAAAQKQRQAAAQAQAAAVQARKGAAAAPATPNAAAAAAADARAKARAKRQVDQAAQATPH